jgi:5'-deoxynucleotidase YfbR-like HD superfamily hydrolase
VLHTQTVGEHSWRVATIHTEIWPHVEEQDLILRHILLHDATEMWTGDIPFPAKRLSPALASACADIEDHASREMGIEWRALSTEQRRRIKVCDLLEMWEFGLIEMSMGNSYARPIVADTIRAAFEMTDEKDRDTVNRWTVETSRMLT